MKKQKISCKVIEDLYPAYADGLCSAETKQLVESHLADCAACRKLYGEFPPRQADTDPPDIQRALKKYRRKARIRRIFVWTSIVLAVLILIAASAICWADGYIPLFGKLRAQSRLTAYSGHKVRCTFDIYNGEYRGGGLIYKLREDLIIDSAVNDEAKAAINAAYIPLRTELCSEGMTAAETLDAYTAVDGADFGQQFSRIYWYVWMPQEMSDAEAIKQMALLTDRLTAAVAPQQITGIQLEYNTLTGCYRSLVPLGKQPLTNTAVQESAQRQERLSEEYLEWQAKGGKELPFTYAEP